MGATVTTNKLAAAFKTSGGKIVYVLFEETYEKNCHPHSPHWGCIFIGSLSEAVERVFSHASACEGGSLQNRSGHITPEGYIAGWMKELAVPVEMPDEVFSLSVGGWGSSISTEEIEKYKAPLSALGRDDLIENLCANNRPSISLYADIEVVLALYGKGHLSPWKILKHAPIFRDRNAELGYLPKPAKAFEVVNPQSMKVDGDNLLLKRPDGSWFCAGWEYSIVGEYIRHLWETELREPGSYRKRIKAYRDALQSGPMVPEGTKVEIDETVGVEYYQTSRIQSLATEYPIEKTDKGFKITVTKENSYMLTCLPPECTTWIVDDLGEPFKSEQLSLLAA